MTRTRLWRIPNQIFRPLLSARRHVPRFSVWVLATVALSISLGLLASYLALEHNPQEAFCVYVARGGVGNFTSWNEPCAIRWLPLTIVFFSWFAAQVAISVVARSAWRALRGMQ